MSDEPVWQRGPLHLRKDRATRFVFLSDVHVPDNIPLDAVFSFMEDFTPDHTILGGDILDMKSFSHWERETPRKARKMPSPRGEYDVANERFFSPLRAACPRSRRTYLLGNHEQWSEKTIDHQPEGEGYWEIWRNVKHVDAWVENKSHTSLGKLTFLHGDIIGGSSKTCADRMLNLYRRSVRFGHFHSLNEASYTSPVDIADRHTARCCGTLQRFQPGYMKHRPHAWIHAFTYGFVEPTGTFWDTTVRINNGVFYAEGRRYRA